MVTCTGADFYKHCMRLLLVMGKNALSMLATMLKNSFRGWEFALSRSIIVPFMTVVVSTQINRKHYFQGNLHFKKNTKMGRQNIKLLIGEWIKCMFRIWNSPEHTTLAFGQNWTNILIKKYVLLTKCRSTQVELCSQALFMQSSMSCSHVSPAYPGLHKQ